MIKTTVDSPASRWRNELRPQECGSHRATPGLLRSRDNAGPLRRDRSQLAGRRQEDPIIATSETPPMRDAGAALAADSNIHEKIRQSVQSWGAIDEYGFCDSRADARTGPPFHPRM